MRTATRSWLAGAVALAALSAASGCDSGRRPSAPAPRPASSSPAGPFSGGDDENVSQSVAPLIVDATRNPSRATPAFHWIPPIVTAAAAFTTLDQTGGASALTIRIDRLYPDFAVDPSPKATFTGTAIRMVTGASDPAFMGVTGPFYGANWTPGATVAAGQTYRITVSAGTAPVRVLGVADVQVVANATAAGMVDRTRFVPLVAGSGLAVVFRLEAKDSDGDSVNDWKDNCPATANFNQLDSNADGRGNACQCLTMPNGTACSTGCRSGETCQAGACTGGTAVTNGTTCSTGNPCKTAEVCTAGTCGGTNRSNTTTCTTGNQCKQGELCTNGTCGGGSNRPNTTACTPGNPCKTGALCNNGTCGSNRANATACSTGNSCQQGEVCTNGACGGGSNVANGAACNDGNLCTQADTCQTGICTGAMPVSCVANSCHAAGSCDPGRGVCPAIVANGTTCDDGKTCTQSDSCQTGTCTGSPVANGTACNDGNACTQTDSCQAGACAGANPKVCTAQDQCHVAGTCNMSTGACSNPPVANGTLCSDGNACTQTDSCQTGTCTGTNPKVCTAQDQCHVAGTCSTSTGACSNPPAANGTLCSDGNACTQADSCQTGVCTGANPKVCMAVDACHGAGMCSVSSGVCSSPPLTGGTCGNNPYEYDGAGRLVRDGGAVLAYDGRDGLVSLTPAAGVANPKMTSGRAVVPMLHTYGYDGLRTTTTTNAGVAGQTTEYWFSQDYSERSDGRRDHYIRVGDRLVARVSYVPGTMAGAIPGRSTSASNAREKLADATGTSAPAESSTTIVAAVAIAAAGLAFALILFLAAGLKTSRQGPRRRLATSALAGVMLAAALAPATSCESLGVRRSSVTTWTKSQELYFHHSVAAGPALLTDSTGAVFEERRYEPFGGTIDARRASGGVTTIDFRRDPQNILNKETDPTTEWSYHGARWMAPQTARWLSPDPSVKEPDAKQMEEPWALNPYAYVNQSPTNLWDPGGDTPKGLKEVYLPGRGENVWIKDPEYIRSTRPQAPMGSIEYRPAAGGAVTVPIRGRLLLSGNDPRVQTQLEKRGTGFSRAGGDMAWGRAATVEKIHNAGRMFNEATKGKYQLLVGGISTKGGGANPDHNLHDSGLDMDVYVVDVSTGKKVDHMSTDSSTVKALQAAINAFRDSSGSRVEKIWFNNHMVERVEPLDGHDDHLHVRVTESVPPKE